MKIKKIIFFPLGSYEYHGTQLPAETDSIISQNIASALYSTMGEHFYGDAILLPALHYGLSMEHQGFPKTMYITHKTFYDYVLELLNSIHEDNVIICIINGHGGNKNTVQAIEADYNYSHNKSKVFAPPLFSREIQELCISMFSAHDTHAGSVEASLMSYYTKQIKKEYSAKTKKVFPGSIKYFRNIEIYSDNIIQEQPLVIADPEKGKQLHEKMVEAIKNNIFDLITNIEKVKA